MKTQFSELLENTPAESLLVGTLTTTDRLGSGNTSAIIEGTPEGLRMLAQFLLTMADAVESGDAQDKGWHLSLSPDDVPALRTHNVMSLSLGCTPARDFHIPKPPSC